MKKLFIVFGILGFLSLPVRYAFGAVTPTPTKAPTPTGQSITQIEQQINNLKDKIASRVAQLKLVQKQGVIGTVTDVSETQITIKDTTGAVHFIDVDELTKFSSPNAKSNFGISDITKNTTIGVLGLYNKDSRRLLARFVDVLVIPQYISGAVAAMDKTNFTLTIAKDDGTQTVVEIEDVTKTSSYNNTATLTKSGFSKIQTGERVYIVGYTDKQNNKQIIASRIISFPTLPINPKIGNVVPQITPDVTVSPTPTPVGKKTTTK